ncbi:MAG: DNA polymerase II [Oligosphaeraceae bacterium]|nr:DNA polymerase II [Oligosphaeraceae bacterium]
MDIGQLVHSREERIVALEVDEYGRCELFRRQSADVVQSEVLPFHPWLLCAGPELAGQLENRQETIELAGAGSLRSLVFFPDLAAYDAAIKQLRKITGQTPSSALAPYRLFTDHTQQLLTMLPLRLFHGMTFPQLKRLQLDIECKCTQPGGFPHAEREGDEVIMIALRDSSGWETCLSSENHGEKALLEEMIKLVQERDPDVIEGHNIFNFDLPYLQKRCRLHRIGLNLGRGGRGVQSRSSRLYAAERIIAYERFQIYGRHVIDTYQLVMLHDVVQRDMDSYGLKAAAKYFGLASDDRTYVDGDEISQVFAEDPERLKEYALDDARETDAISKLLSPSYFYQAQILPLSYQNCVSRGNATRIDALLCAEYMQARQSLPTPQAAQEFQGALTASVEPGLFNNVWHIDVRSLYPSVILANDMHPRSDEIGVFNRILGRLRDFRLQAKDAMRHADGEQRDYYQALQSSFKILINSFYGYLGFAQGTFNDYNMARAVTAQGRDILSTMQRYLAENGAVIIEMDTDGIYFCPPQDIDNMAEMQSRVQSILPEGIEVELDSEYLAMYAYKSKNYALLERNGKVSITGAALKSRGLEPFQRNYMREMLTLLLHGRAAEMPALHSQYEKDIKEHRLPLKDLSKSEYLSTSPEAYSRKLAEGKGRRSAAYELAIASGENYRQGDQVQFYVTGDKKKVSVVDNSKLLSQAKAGERDENIEYYLDKLKQLKQKFI